MVVVLALRAVVGIGVKRAALYLVEVSICVASGLPIRRAANDAEGARVD